MVDAYLSLFNMFGDVKVADVSVLCALGGGKLCMIGRQNGGLVVLIDRGIAIILAMFS